jgi:hypothetical protein
MAPTSAAQKLRGKRFSARTLAAFRLLVAELHRRGYDVLLVQPALNSAYVRHLDALPGAAEADARYRADVLDPAASGADAVLVLEDERSLGLDASVFYDYGHMNPRGAAAQTHRLAQFIRASHLVGGDTAVAARGGKREAGGAERLRGAFER